MRHLYMGVWEGDAILKNKIDWGQWQQLNLYINIIYLTYKRFF